MKFRDAEQRARVCRALLTTALKKDEIDRLWNRLGPTDLVCTLLREGVGNLFIERRAEGIYPSRSASAALSLVWSVWFSGAEPSYTFKIDEALATWSSEAWEVLEGFCAAVADDTVENLDIDTDRDTALDAWVRSIESLHGWRKVDEGNLQ